MHTLSIQRQVSCFQPGIFLREKSHSDVDLDILSLDPDLMLFSPQELASNLLQQTNRTHVAFASLGLSPIAHVGRVLGKEKIKHPTCAHEKDLQSLFRDLDSDSQGFLDVQHLRVSCFGRL